MSQRFVTALFASTAIAGLAACGGGLEPQLAAGTSSQALQVQAVIAPLLADDGAVMPSEPQAEPADAGARTRSGRYASTPQAEQLEHALGLHALRVDVGCCGQDGVDAAVRIAQGMQAALNLDKDAPVLVRSGDLRLAATAVNQLDDAGYSRVWLVTRSGAH